MLMSQQLLVAYVFIRHLQALQIKRWEVLAEHPILFVIQMSLLKVLDMTIIQKHLHKSSSIEVRSGA